ncbi:hypothetical protein [Crenalkalicoccus roseus]|uniref:hypothetical protein n=1 Tax=Crenalkalicoccus roseus TaxID=1485588 RepID=UPI001081E173|nr:hypothetical protein [Crenalkalicoccus roseus]
MTQIGTDLRLLGSVLAAAPAEKLARVIAMVDGLRDRSAADRLLDGARPRLRGLAVPRPLRLARVLFLPLDGLIVDANAWKPDSPTLPRTALAPLAAAVRTALGAEAEALDALCAGRTLAELSAVEAIGARLWPAAAQAPTVRPPPGWKESGLPERFHALLAERCRAAWRHGVRLWPAVRAGAEGPPESLLHAALRGPAQEGGLALDTALHALLARAARPGRVVEVATALAPSGAAAQHALDAHLAATDPAARLASASSTALAACEAWRLCEMIEDLEASASAAPPQRRERLRALRRAADAACRHRFAALLQSELLGHGAEDVAAREEAARGLASLAASGRRLGGAESYDAALRNAAVRLTREGASSRADALRLAEILVGPEAALRLVG